MGSDPNVKQLTVTGGAAESFLHKGTTRRRRRNTAAGGETRRSSDEQRQTGGTSPGTTLQIQANKMPNEADTSSKAVPSAPETLAKTIAPSVPAAAPLRAAGGGGSEKPVRVVLAAGKKKPTKVILAPAKVKKAGGPGAAPSQVSKTRKVAKKIRMSLGGFGKRMTRANTIRNDSKKEPIESVRKTLVEAKLIKQESKAPEEILRKMYADYLMLKNRAL